MLVIAIGIEAAKGHTNLPDSHQRLEFSKLNSDAFQRNCTGLQMIPIQIEKTILGYACVPLSASLCSLNRTCENEENSEMSDLHGLLPQNDKLCCMPKASGAVR